MTLPEHIRKAIHEYIPHMEGWTTAERACEMAAAILETRARVCVDIGVFAARSTIAQGFACRELGGSITYGIDPWSPEAAYEGDDIEESAKWWKEKSNLDVIHQQAMKAVWDHRLEPWVVMIRARSQHVSQLFPQIDFLNIDGGHGEEASTRDVALYVPRVVCGGVIMFDDSDWATTQRALRMIEVTCDLISDTGKARTYRKR